MYPDVTRALINDNINSKPFIMKTREMMFLNTSRKIRRAWWQYTTQISSLHVPYYN